jgi:uncharacterized membrane protein
MDKREFLDRLERGLAGLSAAERADILADYEAHFAEAARAGRDEREVADALGDPVRLAKEIRAEAGIRRWERERSPQSLAGAILALVGLAAVDVVVLLPLLFWVGLITVVVALVMLALLLVGLVLMSGVVGWHPIHIAGSLSRMLYGIGFASGAIGGGALLLIGLEWLMRLLARYARLHYRLFAFDDDALSRR